MTLEEAIDIVENFNKWRRGNDDDIEQPNPAQVGIALDILIIEIKFYHYGLGDD